MANPWNSMITRLRWSVLDYSNRYMLRSAMAAVLSERGTINILQIGANDGRIGDPIHGFVRAHPGRSRVILAEPQPDLIPILTESYAFHPAKVIFQGAVGTEGRLVLYKVRKACWPDLVTPYAAGWPDYRAPTGATSARREVLVDWLTEYYRGTEPLDTLIESFEVDCVSAATLIQRAGLFERLDLLQVDVEGCDDEVIRASDISTLRPALIHFEATHLGPERYAAISGELRQLGYFVQRQGIDALARLR